MSGHSSIASEQLASLRALLAALHGRNAFYTRRLEEAGVTGEISSLADFSARVPCTTKADLVADQAAHPPYGSNFTYPVEQYTRFCQTSGTTSRPIAILDAPDGWEWMLENWRKIYGAAGIGRGDRIYFAFSFGPFLGFWTAFESAAKLGCLCFPGGGLSTSARLRALIDHRANVLCCTPTYALHLAEQAQRDGVDLATASVRKIIVAGEPGGSTTATRARMSELWHGAEILDHYGMTEVGPVAYQGLGQPDVLSILESSYFAEILQPGSNAPASAEETGELVLTTLGRIGNPLLRYRTGDLVRRVPGDDGFTLAGGILGRVDDMIVVRGVNVYPSAVDEVVRSIPSIQEYRVEVTRSGELTEAVLDIESENERDAEALSRAFAVILSLRIPVRRVPPGTLPRFEMKARRWHVTSPSHAPGS